MYRKVVVLLSVAVLGCAQIIGTTQASASGCVQTTLVDSYAVNPALELLSFYSDPIQELFSVGQSFTGTGVVVDSARFSLSGDSGIAGNAYAEIWSHTGTFGVDGLPGTVLATSDLVDEAILTPLPTLIKFIFSGVNRITPAIGTNYFMVVNLITQSSADKYGYVYYQGTYPSEVHPGNMAYVGANMSLWRFGDAIGTLIFEVAGPPGCLGKDKQSKEEKKEEKRAEKEEKKADRAEKKAEKEEKKAEKKADRAEKKAEKKEDKADKNESGQRGSDSRRKD